MARERIGTRVRAAVAARGLAIWGRDREGLGPLASLANRVARLVVWCARGVVRHGLPVQAAALTYYTVFAVVPLLLVLVWMARAVEELPAVTLRLPAADARLAGDNAPLRQALRAIEVAVGHGGARAGGVAGLAALLYSVVRMFGRVEKAVSVIVASRRRAPLVVRLLGYLALLALPLVLMVASGAIAAVADGPVGAAVLRLLGGLPLLRLLLGGAVGLGVLALGLTLLYAAMTGRQVPVRSSALGGLMGALMLGGVLWAFARLQVGVSKAGLLQSGLAALPVFMLWAYSSWFVVLLGAEVAVGHAVDGGAPRGTACWQPDASLSETAAVVLMIEAAGAGGQPITVERLCARLRLLPGSVRLLAGALVARGMLVEPASGRYRLACDPRITRLAAVLRAVSSDPALDGARASVMIGLGPAARTALLARAQAALTGCAAGECDPTLAMLVPGHDRQADPLPAKDQVPAASPSPSARS